MTWCSRHCRISAHHAIIFNIMALVVLATWTFPVYAQDEFFDKMLSVSDQELEKTSEEAEIQQPTITPDAAQIEEMKRTIEMLTPLEPMPVIPNIITPVPPISEAPKEDLLNEEENEQVEILLEEPPLSDNVLKQTNDFLASPEMQEPMASTTTPIEVPEATLKEVKTLSEDAAEMQEPTAQNLAPHPQETQNITPNISESWVGSLMFTDEEYRILRQAINFYERRTGRNKTGSGIIDNDEGISSRGTSPSFYLGSIAYISKEDWAVWLNNIKYTHEKPQQNIIITAISPDEVQLVWNIDSLDITAPNWRNKLILSNNGNYASRDNQIHVNNGGTKIIFTLRPNQSFLSSTMGIVEGRADSVL